jgi:hypothetical protein
MNNQMGELCGGAPPTWSSPISAVDFIRTTPDGTSESHRSKGGAWGACELCSTLIEQDATVKAPHAHFRANRAGPRSAVSTSALRS